jgi:iron-sulfur cluster assembly accessory protein
MKVTSQASEIFKKILSENENPQAGIRVFSNKGCCGAAIQMTLAENPEEGDHQTDMDGVKFFIENEAIETLEGVTIHFEDGSFMIEGLHEHHDGCCC